MTMDTSECAHHQILGSIFARQRDYTKYRPREYLRIFEPGRKPYRDLAALSLSPSMGKVEPWNRIEGGL